MRIENKYGYYDSVINDLIFEITNKKVVMNLDHEGRQDSEYIYISHIVTGIHELVHYMISEHKHLANLGYPLVTEEEPDSFERFLLLDELYSLYLTHELYHSLRHLMEDNDSLDTADRFVDINNVPGYIRLNDFNISIDDLPELIKTRLETQNMYNYYLRIMNMKPKDIKENTDLITI